MRKPRDYDAELKALDDKAKQLKDRKVRQLGELVAATGAGTLDMETLAGGLLAMAEADDPAQKEGWRKRGDAFFQGRARGKARGVGGNDGGAQTGDSEATSDRSQEGAA